MQVTCPPAHRQQPADSLSEDRGREGRKEERRKKAAGMGATSKPGAHGREKKTQRVKGGKGRSRGDKAEEEEWEERTLSFMSTEEVMQRLPRNCPPPLAT